MFEIMTITPELTLDIRQQVLRPYQSADECIYDTDHKEGSFHVGAFHDGTLISIASFCVETNQELSMEKHYRLRAMATLEEYRKLGAGRQVVKYAEGILKEYGTDLLWCMARTKVQEYYSSLDFKAHGEVFDYPPIGPHIVMYKFLR